MQAKSDEIAAHFGEEGNQHMKSKEYMQALLNYNK